MRFNGVAYCRSGPVRFDVSDLRWDDLCVRTRLPHEPRLSLRTGKRDAIGVAILIHGRSNDHRVDRIAVRQGVGKPLHQHHARAFAAHKAVGRGVERLAFAFGRQHPGLGKSNEPIRHNQHGRAAGDRRFATPRQNVLASDVYRRQRGRTCGVHRDAWAAQIQAVGNAVGRDAVSGPCGCVRADAGTIRGGVLNPLIVTVGEPDEHADIRALLQIQNQACILNRLPSCLQQEPVQRIHIGRFPQRDAEKLRIKLVNPSHKSPAPGDGLPRHSRLSVVKPIHVPAIGRHIRNRLTAFDEQFPK